MNWDQIQGRWSEFKGKVREQYGELTDDEIEEARGERDQMLGLIQRKYGKTKQEAEKEVDELMGKM